MNYRQFGRAAWQVSEIGYGMWGIGSWAESDDQQSLSSLQAAVDAGCNFFDTAYAYGDGRSEKLLGQTVRANQDKRLYTATKVPPKNQKWPAPPAATVDECFPPDHLEEFVHCSLKNSGLESFDLVQLHVWQDHWVEDDRWAKRLDDLRRQGLLPRPGPARDRVHEGERQDGDDEQDRDDPEEPSDDVPDQRAPLDSSRVAMGG